MQITVENFGGFKQSTRLAFKTQTLPNGVGKTTMINAYIFALTGKTINGFEPRNEYSKDEDITSVELYGFFDFPKVRRTTFGASTKLYVGDEVAAQVDLEAALMANGIEMTFLIACANANVLTSHSLDAAELRKILSSSDVLNTDEYDEVKKEQTLVRKKRKIAEQNAKTSLIVPNAYCDTLTLTENAFEISFKKSKRIVNEGVLDTCPTCGRKHSEKTIFQLNKEYDTAKLVVENGLKEFVRISAKRADYDVEQEQIKSAKALIEISKQARKDLIKHDNTLKALADELADIDAASVKAHLPEYVDVITEIKMKNGNFKPTCTLEYQGVKLRSINHAKRIEICVHILDTARSKKGLEEYVPIVVDNAEAVEHSFENYNNLILLSAPPKE